MENSFGLVALFLVALICSLICNGVLFQGCRNISRMINRNGSILNTTESEDLNMGDLSEFFQNAMYSKLPGYKFSGLLTMLTIFEQYNMAENVRRVQIYSI